MQLPQPADYQHLVQVAKDTLHKIYFFKQFMNLVIHFKVNTCQLQDTYHTFSPLIHEISWQHFDAHTDYLNDIEAGISLENFWKTSPFWGSFV